MGHRPQLVQKQVTLSKGRDRRMHQLILDDFEKTNSPINSARSLLGEESMKKGLKFPSEREGKCLYVLRSNVKKKTGEE